MKASVILSESYLEGCYLLVIGNQKGDLKL